MALPSLTRPMYPSLCAEEKRRESTDIPTGLDLDDISEHGLESKDGGEDGSGTPTSGAGAGSSAGPPPATATATAQAGASKSEAFPVLQPVELALVRHACSGRRSGCTVSLLACSVSHAIVAGSHCIDTLPPTKSPK